MTPRSTDVAILGAGVVGLTIAERLTDEGRDVVLVDPATPGMGASYGNAGTIADYAVMPVGTPEVLRGILSLLFDRNSPLAIRRAALPSLMPWLLRFAWQSRAEPARRNALALADLLSDATALWQGLAFRLGAEDLVQDRGCLYLYDSDAARQSAEANLAFRRGLGVEVESFGAATLDAMEPGLSGKFAGAAFFPRAIFLSDPGEMMRRLAAHVLTRAEHLALRADRLTRRSDGVLVEGAGLHLHARRVVIAAGAQSRALALQAGDPVPLDTERGYHVEWDMAVPRLSRPACPTRQGFYLCPMAGRLRVAGTVELGGLAAPPSPHRIARLVAGAQGIFPDLGTPTRTWMGFRPSMPDSLPVIGPSRAGAEVIHAYGHGHIGVTLAPATARIVADLVAGRTPNRDLAAVLPARF